MSVEKTMYVSGKDNINYVQLATDASAILYVFAVITLRNMEFAEVAALGLFCMATFINAYLKGTKINIVCIWCAAFYGFCMLSMLWAYDAQGAWSHAPIVGKVAVAVIFLSLYIDGDREINVIYTGILISGALLVLRIFYKMPLSELGSRQLGLNIEMNPNIVGNVYVYTAVVCMNYMKKINLYYIAFGLCAVLVLFSGSRKALVSLFIIIFLFYFNKIKKPSNVFYILPAGALFFALYYLTMNNPQFYHLVGRRMEYLFNYFLGEGDIGSSTRIRMELIQLGVEQFKNKMLIGYGMHSFQYMNQYKFYAHNNYIEILVNYGIIGAVLYYSLQFVMYIKLCLTWLTKTREVILPIIIMTMILVNDYGMVSYYSSLNLILLVVSYRATVLADHMVKGSTS
jgi:hypothetical protein